MNPILIQNEARCRKCNDIIFSRHRHDYQKCSCGAIAVDGGMDYIRRVGDKANIEERVMHMDQEVLSNCIEAANWAKQTGRNDLGTALAVIRALRDGGLLNENPKDIIDEQPRKNWHCKRCGKDIVDIHERCDCTTSPTPLEPIL